MLCLTDLDLNMRYNFINTDCPLVWKIIKTFNKQLELSPFVFNTVGKLFKNRKKNPTNCHLNNRKQFFGGINHYKHQVRSVLVSLIFSFFSKISMLRVQISFCSQSCLCNHSFRGRYWNIDPRYIVQGLCH